MNKKGFTLIELLVTIVIMALILIMVVPSITALRNSNKDKPYEYYAESLVEAAKIFVDREGEDINSIGAKNFIGCVDITYQDLLDSDLIKPFSDENIDCSNATVRYTKSKKSSSYNYDMTCTDTTTNEVVYVHKEIDNKACSIIDTDDKTPPTCGEVTGDSTEWTKDDRTITINCSDDRSGCESVTKTFDSTTKIGYIDIKDGNNNTTSCPVDVYIDKTPPVCSNSGGSDNWTRNSVTILGTCTDSQSGCQTPSVSKLYDSEGEYLKQSPGVITDNVGNTTTCPSDQTVRIDRSVATPYILKVTNERAPMVCDHTFEEMKAGVYGPIHCTLYAYDPPIGFSQHFNHDDKNGSGINAELSYFQAYGPSCRNPSSPGTFPWGQWNTNAWGNYGISHCSSAEYYLRYRDNVGNLSDTLYLHIYYGN